MSQSRKRDIADFFRANARDTPLQSPRKRRTPSRENGRVSQTSQVKTPSTVRRINHDTFPSNFSTPKKALSSPVVTPTTGRSLSLAYRSPGLLAKQANTISLFDSDTTSHVPTEKSVTPLTFADPPNSSRKVIEHGKLVAVRDSDESDNESLGSLTDIFERKKPDTSFSDPDGTSFAARQEAERVRSLNVYTGGRLNPIVNRERMRALQRKEREYKLDVGLVIDEDQKAEEARTRIAQIEAELEQSTKEIQESQQRHLDSRLLAAILKGNVQDTKPEDLARLMSAVDRTEALVGERAYCFFGPLGPQNLIQEKSSKKTYPATAIPYNLWKPKDTATRNRMYLSGTMTDLARRGGLTDEAIRWTYDSIPQEPDTDLRHAYLSCCAAASSIWTRANVIPADIQHIFVLLGAEPSAILDNAVIESRRQHIVVNQKPDLTSLLSALRVLDAVCQDMDIPTLSKLVSLITRLCLDQKIMLQNQTMQAIECLLRKLVDLSDSHSRQYVHDRISSDLISNLKEPVLQAQFISHLSPSSSAGAKLRVRLAASFLLGSKRAAKLLKPCATKSILSVLLNHVNAAPIFQLSSETNFPDLAATVFLLDATVSSGHVAKSDIPTDENTFNSQVDSLADRIHDLFTAIADAGASHLQKTEAKDGLQALYNRLLFAVRTKIRRKKTVFDANDTPIHGWRSKEVADDAHRTGGQKFIQRFLKEGTRQSEEKEVFDDFPEV